MVFIGWVKGHEDQAPLAKKLGAKAHFITYGPRKKSLLPLRYLVQAIRTWRLLRRERADVIITMIPPTFLALEAWLFMRLHGGRTVIESHSANFTPPSWMPTRTTFPPASLLSAISCATRVKARCMAGAFKMTWDSGMMSGKSKYQ